MHQLMRKAEIAKRDLKELISALCDKKDIVLVEIGSYMGESACLFAQSGKFSKIICVDPWTDIPGNGGNSYRGMANIEKKFDENVSGYGCIEKFKGTASELVKSGRLNGFLVDMVYIDGLHTYEGCSADIAVCRDSIRPVFAFAGPDYTDKIAHVVGVKKAVDEAFGAPDAVFCDNSWLKFV